MHFNKKHLAEFGYKHSGVLEPSLDALTKYVKEFPEHYGIVVFSTLSRNKIVAFRLTKEQYEGYKNGDFSLSVSGRLGKTPQGWDIKDYGRKEIFAGGEIKNRKTLKAYLDIAEEYVTAEKAPQIVLEPKIVG